MEKIGINIVGVGPSCDDVSTQLLNISGGFRGVTAKIVSRGNDSLYLGITSDRAYIVSVEGDLSLSTETSDSIGSKIAGVTGYDIDWTETARQFGNGTGKIIVTNPDAPSEVSTFEVFMGEPRSVVVDFAANTGCVEMDICEDAWPSHVLVGSRNFSPSGDLDVVGLRPVRHTKYPLIGDPLAGVLPNRSQTALDILARGSREELRGTFNHSERSAMSNDENNPFFRPGVPLILFGDFNEGGLDRHYHRAEDVCAHGPSVECALVDALIGGLGFPRKVSGVGTDLTQSSDHLGLVFKLHDLVEPTGLAEGPVLVRATLEDLMASYGNEGDGNAAIEVGPETRDFDQLNRTRSNDLERIEQAVAKANALGIDTSNVASRRDAALAKLSVFSDRFELGGLKPVTETEVAVISEVFGELWSIHSDLDTLVSHWHHYKGHEANHDRWEARLADRKRSFKVADDAGDNRIATSYVTYAANPEETLAASKAAFAELFQAIQKGDLRAAHQADTRARQFSTREHLLDALVRRGKLVVVENDSTTV